MELLSVCLIALSLAVDAAAAAICCGLSDPNFAWRDALRLGAWFGGFQAGMTAAGGIFGNVLSRRFQFLGALLAFGLLFYLGSKMLLNALRPLENPLYVHDLTTPTVALLAVATSLDALAVGVSVAFLDVPLWQSAALIGAAAFFLSASGSLLGRNIGQRFHRWASAAGGLALAAIGAKVLWGAIG